MIKEKIKNLLITISRLINLLIPFEFKTPSLENKLKENLINETFNEFKDHFKKSVLFNNVWKIREYAIKTSLLNDHENTTSNFFYLEFGVFKGESANFFSKYVNKIYVFDSFEGLKEDWAGTSGSKGDFNLYKKIPKLNSNVEPIVGWVEDTLDDFLKKSPKINFVHMDMDTYSPTKYTLLKIKPYLVKNAIIIFDEFYNYIGWENGEYKAFKEVFKENEFEYKAFRVRSAGYSQCVVSIK